MEYSKIQFDYLYNILHLPTIYYSFLEKNYKSSELSSLNNSKKNKRQKSQHFASQELILVTTHFSNNIRNIP